MFNSRFAIFFSINKQLELSKSPDFLVSINLSIIVYLNLNKMSETFFDLQELTEDIGKTLKVIRVAFNLFYKYLTFIIVNNEFYFFKLSKISKLKTSKRHFR